jgi:hypothetical protein
LPDRHFEDKVTHPEMDASKPFLELLNEKQWHKLLILVLTVAVVTLWISFNAELSRKDVAIAACGTEKEVSTKFWLSVVAKKDSIILAEKEKAISDRDKQIEKFEAKTERVDSYINTSKEQDIRIERKTARNNKSSKAIEDKIKKTAQQ